MITDRMCLDMLGLWVWTYHPHQDPRMRGGSQLSCSLFVGARAYPRHKAHETRSTKTSEYGGSGGFFTGGGPPHTGSLNPRRPLSPTSNLKTFLPDFEEERSSGGEM